MSDSFNNENDFGAQENTNESTAETLVESTVESNNQDYSNNAQYTQYSNNDYSNNNQYSSNGTQYGPNGKKVGQGFGIAALILGIISLLCFWGCCLNFVTGILAIIFGIIQIVQYEGKGMAIAGIITSVISFILTFAMFGLMFSNKDFLDTIENIDPNQSYEDLYKEIYDDLYSDIKNEYPDIEFDENL